MMPLYIGTSGYIYDHWKELFYPAFLPKNEWFNYYQKYFDTVELNVTFYRLPSPSAFENWRKKAKKNFLFAVKGSRFITHVKRLHGIEDSVKLFMERCKILGEHLGPVLWQLPPKMKFDKSRFSLFLEVLMKTNHLLHAIEIRDTSWLNEECIEMIKDAQFTLSFTDYPGAEVELKSADFPFIYIRRHGVKGNLYGGCYRKSDLKKDANLIKKYLKKGKDIFVYFNNDEMAYAVKNAIELQKYFRITR